MSNSLRPHWLQHTRLLRPSLSPEVCSDSCPSSWWCYRTISSSPAPFSFCLQSFSALRSFPMNWLFASGGQNIGASASVLPVNIQGWVPLGLSGLISLLSKGLSRTFSSTKVQKHQFSWYSAFFMVQLSHLYMTTRETIALTIWTFISKVISLLFNMPLRLVIVFLPKSKSPLISCLHSLSTVTLEPKKIKCHCLHFFPFYLPWSDGMGMPWS